MWIENGRWLIALKGRDIKLESRDIVFEGKGNIEVLRHPSPQSASVQYNNIVKRLTENDQII